MTDDDEIEEDVGVLDARVPAVWPGPSPVAATTRMTFDTSST